MWVVFNLKMATSPPKKITQAQLRAKRKQERDRFMRARKAEKRYARSLRAVAKQVGHIVAGFAPNGVVRATATLANALNRYSELLRPWAKEVAQTMIDEVNGRDAKAWAEQGRVIGRELRKEVLKAPTGIAMRALLDEQVDLITSLPTQAAQRVHKLTLEAMSSGVRAAETAKEIMRTGHVTESRAMLIARTETSRTATAMTEARAVYIGSPGYIWRTVGDSDVRPLHRKLNGRIFKWDEPPVSGENGERSHPGAIYNCRCYPEPIIPEVIR